MTDPEPHAYIYAPFKSAQCADAALIFLDSDVLPPFFFFSALPGSLFKEVNQMPWKNIGNDSCHRDLLICDSDSNYKEGEQQAAAALLHDDLQLTLCIYCEILRKMESKCFAGRVNHGAHPRL